MSARLRVVSVLVSLALASLAPPALAAWVTDGNPLCNIRGFQHVGRVARGSIASGPNLNLSGMLLVWQDQRADEGDLYYGLISEVPPPDPAPGRDGTPLVIAHGVQGVMTTTAVEPIPSGAQAQGSAFVIVWYEAQRLRATRIGDQGSWGPNGVAIAPADPLSQSWSESTDDGGRGAIVAWLGTTSAQRLVRAQRLDENGNLLWGPAGVAVGEDTTVQGEPAIARGPGGGAYILRKDHRIAGTVNGPEALALYRLDGNGATAAEWPAEGVVIGGQNPWSYRLLPDGNGGVFVAWTGMVQLSDMSNGLEVRVTRILANGQPATGWSLAGVAAVTRDDGHCRLEDVDLDGTGGVVVVARYERVVGGPSPTRADLFVQRFLGDGSRPASWPAAGRLLSGADEDQSGARLIGQLGGLLAAWRDDRSGTADLYMLRLEPDGTPAEGWDPQGLLLCGAASSQTNVQLAPNSSGGAVFTWQDWRTASTGPDLFIQSVSAAGVLGVPHAFGRPVALSAPRPSPASGPVELELEANDTGTARVDVVDMSGRIVDRWSLEVSPGPNAIRWDLRGAGGRRVAPGIYHLRVVTPWGERARRVVVLG